MVAGSVHNGVLEKFDTFGVDVEQEHKAWLWGKFWFWAINNVSFFCEIVVVHVRTYAGGTDNLKSSSWRGRLDER